MRQNVKALNWKITWKLFDFIHGNKEMVLGYSGISLTKEKAVNHLSNLMGDKFGKKTINFNAYRWRTAYHHDQRFIIKTEYVKVLVNEWADCWTEFAFYLTKKGKENLSEVKKDIENVINILNEQERKLDADYFAE